MSNRYLAAAFGVKLPPSQKSVLVALADGANDQGCTWPSYWHLVYKTSLSERSIKRAVNDLIAAGFVRKEPRWCGDGDSAYRTSNAYWLTDQVFVRSLPWSEFPVRGTAEGGDL